MDPRRDELVRMFANSSAALEVALRNALRSGDFQAAAHRLQEQDLLESTRAQAIAILDRYPVPVPVLAEAGFLAKVRAFADSLVSG